VKSDVSSILGILMSFNDLMLEEKWQKTPVLCIEKVSLKPT
jgi:hypothetical protein